MGGRASSNTSTAMALVPDLGDGELRNVSYNGAHVHKAPLPLGRPSLPDLPQTPDDSLGSSRWDRSSREPWRRVRDMVLWELWAYLSKSHAHSPGRPRATLRHSTR